MLKGQSSRLRIQTVPPSEKIFNGNHRCHTPLWPKKCNQQLVTRNGGRAKARIAAPKKILRTLGPKPASQSAETNPIQTEMPVVKLAAKKLFPMIFQFI
jgi:hypothetical protein